MAKLSLPYFQFFLISTVLLVLAAPGFSQSTSLDAKQARQLYDTIPWAPEYRPIQSPRTSGSRAAPIAPVHSIAEWELSEGVMINWMNADLVNRLQEVTTVYVPVDNQTQKDNWIAFLNSNSIPQTNMEYLFITTDTVWTRDYGPWFIWDADNDLGISDYSCDNHGAVYGPNDSAFPSNFATLFGINYYDSELEHVGGNWYPNGYATSFSTNRVYTCNPWKSLVETNGIIQDYWGIDTYYTVPVAYWTIEHLDCWIKPADPETLMVVEYESDSSYYLYGERINEYYETLQSPWGRPYEIHRLPMFKMSGTGWYEFKPYCNSLCSNNRIYVPITYTADDQVALDAFQDAFEGYEIVGVDHMGLGFNDAVHCRTRNFHARELIRIYPMPPGDSEDTVAGYTVTAEVIPPNGSTLLAGYPKLQYSTTGAAPFTEAPMTATGSANTYEGVLPAMAQGITVSYYIDAEDDGGLSAVYPLVAPDGLLHVDVRADTTAPELSRFQRMSCAAAGQWPPSIRILCKDDMYTPEVRVEYAINGTPQPAETLTREPGTYWYSGMLGGSVAEGDVVSYRIVGEDQAVSNNSTSLPPVGDVFCPVVGTGGIGVVDLAHTPRTGPFITEVLGELGLPFTYYTTWPTDFSVHDNWFVSIGVHFCSNHVLSNDEANDLVVAMQDGKNIYLESNDTWCFDPEKDTLKPWFGVTEISDGGDFKGGAKGVTGTIMAGLHLAYVAENAYMDEIGATTPAKIAFRSGEDNKGRGVTYDAGTYKTVAVSFGLGGLQDHVYPATRKEVLLRVLDFFGVDVDLYSCQECILTSDVPVHILGDPGELYLLFGSLGDGFVSTGYGDFRLDTAWLFVLLQSVIPVSGREELLFRLPNDPSLEGFEVHLQALVGSQFKVGSSWLTNRDVLTILPMP